MMPEVLISPYQHIMDSYLLGYRYRPSSALRVVAPTEEDSLMQLVGQQQQQQWKRH